MVILHDFCNDNFRIFLHLQTDHDRKAKCHTLTSITYIANVYM